MWRRYSLNSSENLLEHWQSEMGDDPPVQRSGGGRGRRVIREEQDLKHGGREYWRSGLEPRRGGGPLRPC